MPKAKKGKDGKLAKMTDEERALFMEQQRLAEEEMRKNKEDMLAQFLKNKLIKEEKTSNFNLNKLNHQWRAIMREAKSKELKKDLEILSQTFERVVDRKQSVIRSLGKDLAEAEEQFLMSLRSHLQNVDSLIDIQRVRVNQLAKEFAEEQRILVEEFEAEKTMIKEQHKREMRELQDILHATDHNIAEKESEAKSEFSSTADETRAKSLEDKHTLRVLLEGCVEDLWNQFNTALHAYQEATDERRKSYEELKAKDEMSAKIIDQQMRKLQRVADMSQILRNKMAANARECDDKHARLKEEKDIMAIHASEMKRKMCSIRTAEQEKLVALTTQSNDAIKQLKEKLKKAERILKLAEMCRKLESEEEKVLPFYSSSLTDEERQDVENAVQELPSEALVTAMYKFGPLDNFWKRYNKVMLDKCALEKEKAVIAQQNVQLRAQLKLYLDGISLNGDLNNTSQLQHYNNMLLVANDRTTGDNVTDRMNIPVTEGRVKRQELSSTINLLNTSAIAPQYRQLTMN